MFALNNMVISHARRVHSLNNYRENSYRKIAGIHGLKNRTICQGSKNNFYEMKKNNTRFHNVPGSNLARNPQHGCDLRARLTCRKLRR